MEAKTADRLISKEENNTGGHYYAQAGSQTQQDGGNTAEGRMKESIGQLWNFNGEVRACV